MGIFSFQSLLGPLKEIEQDLMTQHPPSPGLVNKLQAINRITEANVGQAASEQSTIDEIRKATKRILLVAEASLAIEESFATFNQNLSEEAAQALRLVEDASLRDNVLDLSESVPTYHMRKHFLETLDHPYPSLKKKEALTLNANNPTAADKGRSLDVHQVGLWFINARRRSGWSHIRQKFAQNDLTRMRILVQAKTRILDSSAQNSTRSSILSHNLDSLLCDNLGRTPTSEDKKEFEDDWISMMNWLTYGVKDKVGDWVYDLVAANKKPHKPGQPRIAITAATRSPARKKVSTKNGKPKKGKQRASKTPSIDSVPESSGLDSTPELSMCSTADTSFSSLCSSLSMPPYDPFQQQDDLLQSPTLSVSRKVKALPKRAPQPTLPKPLYTNGADPSTERLSLPGAGQLDPEQTQVNDALVAYSSTQSKLRLPPFDVLGQTLVPLIPRESLSSNSLSAAFF